MKIFSRIFFSSLLFTLLTWSAQAAPQDFVGTWVNTNSHANGIIRLVISKSGDNYYIRAFGKCTPNPCDFGMVPLWTYGKSISDWNHKAATAHYDFSFKDVELVAKLTSRTRLYLEDYNRFTDSSGRENYWKSNRFRKIVMSEHPEDFHSTPQEPEN